MPKSENVNSTKAWLKHPFLHYIKTYKKPFAVGMFALLLTNGFDILSPYIIGRVIDTLSTNAAIDKISFDLLLLLCVSLGTALFRYMWRIYFGRFHQAVAADLRKLLFKKMLTLSQNFHQKTPIGEKMTFITQDIDNFRMGIGPGLLILFDAIIYVGGLIPLMLIIDVGLTIKCLALMPLIPFVIYRLENTLSQSYRKFQDETGVLTSFSQETVSGIKVIKSLGLNLYRSHLFERVNVKLKDYGIKVDKIESAFGPSLEFFVMIGTATLLFVGAKKVVSHEVSIGNFFAFYQYLLRMIWPMTALGFSFMMYQEADSSFDRIKQVLDNEDYAPNGTEATHKGFELNVKDVSYIYPDSPNWELTNINFNLKPTESMAIVGPVGAGKSTLVQLLAMSFNPTKGAVLYENTPIYKFKKQSYRNIATLVPQKIFLFKKSIQKNILDFVDEPSSPSFTEELFKLAHVNEEVMSLPEAENTMLEENGQGLSGGQRQRLALARGLALSPQWLILDDTLSAVDIETEQKILKTLQAKKVQNNMNFIICSHRIQNLSWVDKILVLNKGKAIDMGTHEELYKRCTIYKDLYSSHKKNESSHKEKEADATRKTLNTTVSCGDQTCNK